jgi:hypothetical protein
MDPAPDLTARKQPLRQSLPVFNLPRHWDRLAAGFFLAAFLLLGFLVLWVFPGKSDFKPGDVSFDHPMQAGYATNLTASPKASDAARALLPGIVLPEDFYDFGTLNSTAIVSHQFVIINRGAGTLVIEQAYTTCGCTTAELTGAVIPPGKVSLITIHFDPAYHYTNNATVRRGMILKTNDPIHPQAEIWIQAYLR